MVFVIDDLLEGGLAAGILATISTFVFGEATATAGIAMAETIGVEGVDAIITFTESGESMVSYIPQVVSRIEPIIDELSGEEMSMFEQINIPQDEKVQALEMTKKVALSLAQKIPRDAEGFRNLLKDIITGAIAHKGKIGAVAGFGTSIIGGITIIDQLRKAYQNGKKIPNDAENIYDDLKNTGKDIISDISDTISDGKNLISDLLPKIGN